MNESLTSGFIHKIWEQATKVPNHNGGLTADAGK